MTPSSRLIDILIDFLHKKDKYASARRPD